MWTVLRSLPSPWQRGLATAALLTTVVTLPLGVGLRVTKHPQSPYRWVVSASVISALVGFVVGRRSKSPATTIPASWRDWRPFVVSQTISESREITSFLLTPVDQGSLLPYQPGQFLTLQLTIPGQPRPVIRTYSLSDYAPTPDHYRISIKKETAPPDSGYPPGLASTFLHEHVKVGSQLQVRPPQGNFVLDVHASTPVVLISNGVGITPMISMVKATQLHHPQRPIWFVHGARNGAYHAFSSEVQALQHPHLHRFYRYSRPNPEDDGKYHSQGYVDPNFVATVIQPHIAQVTGSLEANYYLCGSPSFLEALLAGLKTAGIPSSRIVYEVFASTPKPTTVAPVEESHSCEVVFARSGYTLTWHASDGTLLELAEAHQIDHPYGCRAGICLSCACSVQSGVVDYPTPPTGQPPPGQVLLCVGYPHGQRLVLEA